jgi:hypothetical protein
LTSQPTKEGLPPDEQVTVSGIFSAFLMTNLMSPPESEDVHDGEAINWGKEDQAKGAGRIDWKGRSLLLFALGFVPNG